MNWEAFLSKHDFVRDDVRYHAAAPLHADAASKLMHEWGYGAFIGNGMIGAMIYKDSPQAMMWELGRNDVVAHNHLDGIDWSVPRVPIGDFMLRPKASILSESMRLSLWNAETRGVMRTEAGSLEWRSIAHAETDCLVIEWQGVGGEAANAGFRPRHGISPRLAYADRRPPSEHLPPPPVQYDYDGMHVSLQSYITQLPDGRAAFEGTSAVAWMERRISPEHGVIYISIANDDQSEDAGSIACRTLAAAAEHDLEELFEVHRAWWHRYYPASFLTVPDQHWERIYWLQMYKLACATRQDAPVVDNQGPWLTRSPWPGTWWNLNVQLSYLSVYKANRLSLAESLINTLERHQEQLRRNAEPIGLQDGVFIGRVSSTNLVSPCTNPELEMGNLTWTLHNVWRHYRSTMDEALLRRLYPLLRGAVQVYLHLCYLGEDGCWHLPKTSSPEYPGPVHATAYPTEDCNYDLALFRWGCEALLEASERLGLKDPTAKRWRDILARLTPYPTDVTGFRIGKDVGLDISHRHYSHLLMFFPLHLLDPDIPEHRELIRKSMEHWVNFKGALQGYSYTGAACMAATLGDGNKALDYLNEFRSYLLPNTMYVEQGPVIETPLSSAEAIHYMLLQCWGNTIRIFPAVPDAWRDLAFDRLLAEGAFEVSGVWKNGCAEYAVIKSLAGETLRVRPNLPGPLKLTGERVFSATSVGEGVYEIDLKQGEAVILYSGHPPQESELIKYREA